MDWSIQHVTSSPRFPHGNAHAEKAVGIVKQIYERCQDVKLGLLLLKTMPITNQNQSHVAPCSLFYGCTLKAYLPIYQSINANSTCTLDTEKGAQIEIRDVPSKFQVNQDVWVKVDPHTKWMAGKLSQILPNQSYVVKHTDGHVFTGISTILQKGKVVSNPVQILRLIQTLTPIILGLGRIPSVLNGLIYLLKGAKEWISNYQVTSEDGYFDSQLRQSII